MTIWPPLTGKSRDVSAVAGATAVTVMSACLRAADTAGLTTTSVLLPMTVARAEAYVILGHVPGLVLLVAAVPLLAAVLLPEALLPPGPLSQAATASPAARITAMADSREQLGSKPISFLLRLVKPMATTLRSPRALSLGMGHGNGALIRLRGHRVDLHELGCCRLARGKRVQVA
jgi:hypothetical protein